MRDYAAIRVRLQATPHTLHLFRITMVFKVTKTLNGRRMDGMIDVVVCLLCVAKNNLQQQTQQQQQRQQQEQQSRAGMGDHRLIEDAPRRQSGFKDKSSNALAGVGSIPSDDGVNSCIYQHSYHQIPSGVDWRGGLQTSTFSFRRVSASKIINNLHQMTRQRQ